MAVWRCQSVDVNFDRAIAEIGRRVAEAGDLITLIGVDGHSAAGKSTFAANLAGRLDAPLVRGDDFYRVMDSSERARLTPEEGMRSYYDWQRMRDEVLLPLRSGQGATYRPYDWDLNELSGRHVIVRSAAVVVVEGLFVARPELETLIDITVLVTASPIVRGKRQALRADGTDAWLRRWDAAETWYFKQVRPVNHFDLVVEASDAA